MAFPASHPSSPPDTKYEIHFFFFFSSISEEKCVTQEKWECLFYQMVFDGVSLAV
jgi:hypothetical protein